MNITDKIRAHHVDCMEFMRGLPDGYYDLVLTDPPFGMNYQSNHRKEKYNKIPNDDNLDWLPNWAEELKRIVKQDAHMYVFCSWHKVDVFKRELGRYFNLKNILIWDKNNTGMGDLVGDYAPKYEMVLFFSNGQKKLNGSRDANIIKAKRTNNEHHPTMKPVNLLTYFIEKSTEKGDKVFDSFAGSFSTACACFDTERYFDGCELDADYFAKGVERVTNHVKQLKLF